MITWSKNQNNLCDTPVQMSMCVAPLSGNTLDTPFFFFFVIFPTILTDATFTHMIHMLHLIKLRHIVCETCNLEKHRIYMLIQTMSN